MYFVRSGNIYLPNGSLRGAGRNGDFWESSAYPTSSRSAFVLDFASPHAYPSANGDHYYGFSLRPISLLPISSVVAISTPLMARFESLATTAVSGVPLPIAPARSMLSISILTPSTFTLHTSMTVIIAIPSTSPNSPKIKPEQNPNWVPGTHFCIF